MTDGSVRPRLGSIIHTDGTATPILFEQTADPMVFAPTDLDGQPITTFQAGDTLHVDVLGPGQAVVVPALAERE